MTRFLRFALFTTFVLNIFHSQAQQIILPIEVLGAQWKVVEQSIVLSQEQASQARHLWMQVNNLSYENKASIKINDGPWVDLNHSSVDMQYQEEARGGMVHGGFNTIRFSVPASGFVDGQNAIKFRFNRSDGISIGYRVVKFNLLNEAKIKILDASMFEEEDPFQWTAPAGYDNATAISEGKALWESAPLWSNYLAQDTLGAWYGESLQPAMPINATCSDCHVSDGYDLEYFSYSNESIVERSIFHALSEDEGNKIAAYIRSLSSEPEGPQRHGRPWNPPFQPGPDLENKTIDEWAAGAGIDAVLDKDADMIPHMFPNGIDAQSVQDYFDSDKVEDHTLMPVAVQMPDWKHWLPIIHPKDAFTIDDYYENPTVDIHPKIGLERLENYLNAMPVENRDKAQLQNELRIFHRHFRHFWDQVEGEVRHWRSVGDALRKGTYNEALAHIPDGIPPELTVTSLARMLAVKNFEIMNKHELRDKAEWFVIPEDVDELTERRWQWVGVDYNAFEVPPHFTACASDGNCDRFIGQPVATGHYESTAWYQLQLVLNGGNGNVGGNEPMDWQYQLEFILKASKTSGIKEPMRYYHSLNAMYQTRTWDKDKTPNTGKGFRARQQLPHWFFGMTDSNNFQGFSPNEFPALLDDAQPGLQKTILDALLRQFLAEVQRPEMDLATWDRVGPHGGEHELEPASKNDALVNIESKIGLFYYTDKMYYLIPKFAELGVDCDVINQLVDWSAEAWPNYDWEQFRSLTQATVQIANEDQLGCGNSVITLNASSGNEGDSPIYEWSVNGNVVGSNAPSFSSDQLVAGDMVTVTLQSNSVCANDLTAQDSYTVVDTGFKTWTNKNNEGWTTASTVEVCNDDEVAVMVDIVSEPKLWLDAYQVAQGPAPSEGALVSSWVDRSGNDYDVSADQSALYPYYSPTGMNGKPAVMFGMNDNADGLKLFDTNEDDFMEDDWSIILVGEELTRNSNWADVIGNKSESANDDGWFIRFSEQGYSQVSAGGAYYQDNSTSLPIEFIAMLSKKGRDITFTLNGEVVKEFTMEEGEKITTGFEMYLGLSDKGNPNTGRYHKGPISEVMLFDHAMNNQEREYLEGYLAHKWELKELLPQFHAYKLNSPLDVTLALADGSEVGLNGNNREYNYQINQSLEGEVSFTQDAFTCPEPQQTSSFEYAEDMDAVAIAIEYSLDGEPFVVAESVVARSGQSLTFQPDVMIGTHQWEMPNGTLLDENVDPFIASAMDDESIGNWILHIDYGGCYAGNGRDLPFEVTYDPGVYYDITINTPINGTSDITGDVLVGEGSNLTLLLTPDSGYKLSTIEIDGQVQTIDPNYGDPVNYVLTNVTGDHIIDIIFAPLEVYVATINLTGNGTSDPLGSVNVTENNDLSITFTPDSGHFLAVILVDDDPQEINDNYGEPYTLELTEILADLTIEAIFEVIPQHTVTINLTGDGTTDPTGSVVVEENDDLSLILTPAVGSKLSSIILDGTTQSIDPNYGEVTQFDLNQISSDHVLDVIFAELEQIAVNISSTGNGTTDPSGEQFVTENSDFEITISPDTGNRLSSISVNDEDQSITPNNGEEVQFSISNVLSTQDVLVSFEEIFFDIVASSGSNGSISPTGTSSLKYGSNATYQFNPDEGYRILDVLVDQTSLGTPSSYEFLNITTDHTIRVTFEEIPVYFTISASSAENGTLSPAGETEILKGESQAFTITPDADYRIDDVMVDGVSVGAVASYTFDNVIADHTIEALFIEDLPPLGVNELTAGEASIYPNPSNGEFHVDVDGEIRNVTVVSLLGQSIQGIQTLDRAHFKIADKDLGKGYYFVKVQLSNNKVHIFKLLISK